MSLYYILLLAISVPLYGSFDTLSKIKKYAAHYPETPQSDTIKNSIDPDYSTFYYSITPTISTRILNRFGLSYRPLWNVHQFEELLKQVINTREQVGLSGRTITSLSVPQDTHLLIWGDLHGSFHSLVRSLDWLEEQKIIDQNLTIIKNNYCCVFNGNVIDRSAYSIETLMLVLMLLHKNPTSVFYVRGQHENLNYWYDYGLKRELKIRGRPYSSDLIPFGNLISRFFDTLPLALYVNTQENPTDVVRFSHQGRTIATVEEEHPGELLIDEEYLGNIFDISQKKQSSTGTIIGHYQLQEHAKTTTPINVTTLIRTEMWRQENRARVGLGLLDQDLGATTWAVLSSPIPLNREYYNFFYDAYADLHITDSLQKSTLTLYNKDSRTQEPFALKNTFNIITGRETTVPQSSPLDPTILLGSTTSLFRGLPTIGNQLLRGMSMVINHLNRTGGVHGHHIKTIIYNDDYSPSFARQNITTLLERDSANLILLPMGSPTLAAYLDYIREKRIAVLFPYTGGPQFRKSELKGLVHLRASYGQEASALVEHVLKEFGVRNFAFLYQNDAYGIGPMAAAEKALQEHGITSWTKIPYSRADINLTEQAKQMQLAQADAIGFFSTSAPTQELIRQMGIETLSNKKLFAISPVGTNEFRRFAHQEGLEVTYGAVVPNPWISQIEIIKEYRDMMNLNNYSYDVFSLEAYIATRLTIETLKKLTPPFTIDKLLTELESLRHYKFKGLDLDFNPETRSLAQYVWIETNQKTDWLQKPIRNENI